MVDRRMLSYETALETLGFDYDNELGAMQRELPLVEQGIFGIVGSPFQRSAIQDTQRAPAGTPSNGRPKGQTNKKTKQTDPNKLQDNKVDKSEGASFIEILKGMSAEERASLIEEIKNID